MNLRNLCFITTFILVILKAVGIASITWFQALLPLLIGIIISLIVTGISFGVMSKIFNIINDYIKKDEDIK